MLFTSASATALNFGEALCAAFSAADAGNGIAANTIQPKERQYRAIRDDTTCSPSLKRDIKVANLDAEKRLSELFRHAANIVSQTLLIIIRMFCSLAGSAWIPADRRKADSITMMNC